VSICHKLGVLFRRSPKAVRVAVGSAKSVSVGRRLAHGPLVLASVCGFSCQDQTS